MNESNNHDLRHCRRICKTQYVCSTTMTTGDSKRRCSAVFYIVYITTFSLLVSRPVDVNDGTESVNVYMN